MMHITNDVDMSKIPAACIRACTAAGSVDAAVAHWRRKLNFTVEREAAIAHLASYGAWDVDALRAASDEKLAEQILWLSCAVFHEGDTVFFMEG